MGTTRPSTPFSTTTYATKLNSIFSFYNLRFKPSPPQRHNIKMVLEAVMVVVDNSESSRNGDYTPTRYEAQADAVSLIFSAITQANPESSVGLMSMGGNGPGQDLGGFTSYEEQDSRRQPFGYWYPDRWSRTQAPSKQIPTSTHHSLHLLSNPRRREIPHQAGQEDEEEQRLHRLHCFRRAGRRYYQETHLLQ